MDRSSHFFLLASLLLVHSSLINCSSANNNTNIDRSSLIALKLKITSDPQNILTKNWTTHTNICSWVGVTCDSRHNRVTELNISNMGLVGTIPPEIGNLSFLVSLDLKENSFHGPIPPSIFNMTLLEVLDLGNNNLSSSLPISLCKHNLQLKKLRLSYNKLYGEIPSTLEQCSKLEFLSLFDNNFGGRVPREIGNLTLLQILNFGFNNLSGSIPSTIGNISGLQDIRFYDNKFTGEIPSSTCNLRSLQALHLSNNNLQGAIPDCLGNLSKSLFIFHLSANQVSGRIPSTFTKGCTLLSLNLNGNKLEGTLPQSLVNCQGLQSVDVGDNEIRGVFPFWMQTLPQLRILVLRSNMFNGTMLDDSQVVHPFPKLQVLDVSRNAFTGSLPERYFKNFSGMINVGGNKTSDETNILQWVIESRFTLKGLDQTLKRLLVEFTTIDFSSNQFSGIIPPSIGKLNSLIYLNLSHNILTGHIPASLGNISVLESLDLSWNKMDGEIPIELSRLTFLSKLNLSMNNIVGQIPRSTQFSTFENDSYVGNVGLCGIPMTRKCEGNDESSPPEMQPEESDDSEFIDGFGWRFVVLGYGCGFAAGIGVGYSIIKCGSPRWLLELIFGVGYNIKRRKRARRKLESRQINING